MTRQSIPAIFREQAAKLGSRPMVYAKVSGHWACLTWAQVATRVDHVGILSENRPEWLLADLATLCTGAADAPIYPTNTAEQCAYVVRDSGSRVVFASTAAQVEKLVRARAEMPDLTHIVHFERDLVLAPVSGLTFLSLDDLDTLGRESGGQAAVDARVEALGPSDLLTLIYTSGTTGEPKGVMLTHGNLIANCEATLRAVHLDKNDVALSMLPLSHSFERTVGYYLPVLFAGATLYYAEGTDRLAENLAEVRPTILAAVPRIYEKIYATFQRRRAEAPLPQRLLIDWAVGVGLQASRAKQAGKAPGLLLDLQERLAHELVLGKLAARMGGRLRLCCSGGAPLSAEIAQLFHAAGVLILEGYGLSETGPVISTNRPDAFRFGTVGQPIDDVDVRIAPDGEILVRGPNVMRGYWRKPEATAEVLRPDGWLATGDIGELDGDGFLRITDRKKDLIKTAGAKYVAPQKIEGMLALQPHIDQACVIGDERPYCVALIVPAWDRLRQWAESRGLLTSDPASLAREPQVREILEAEVAEVNARLAPYETVKSFAVVIRPFTADEGLLTPTLKLRRKAVTAAYAEEIDRLYAQGSRPTR
jgi:long-chain acyl-CoA synthetase